MPVLSQGTPGTWFWWPWCSALVLEGPSVVKQLLQITVLRGENASAKTLQSVVKSLESDKLKLEEKVKNLEQKLKENNEQPLMSPSGKVRATPVSLRAVVLFLTEPWHESHCPCLLLSLKVMLLLCFRRKLQGRSRYWMCTWTFYTSSGAVGEGNIPKTILTRTCKPGF